MISAPIRLMYLYNLRERFPILHSGKCSELFDLDLYVSRCARGMQNREEKSNITFPVKRKYFIRALEHIIKNNGNWQSAAYL